MTRYTDLYSYSTLPLPPRTALFPYTTLFRSATIGKMTIPELGRRGYSQDKVLGTLAGAGTLGLMIPPSIIMIVYGVARSEEHTSELQSRPHLVCRLLLEKKKLQHIFID